MILQRRSAERGAADHGWLKSKHTFSFVDYYNPSFMGFSCLRVINQDIIDGGSGFPTHGHRDMEIVTYIIRGKLEHKDSTGTSAVIQPGELQRMTAGTGVRHSEFNASATEPCEFLQIWLIPAKMNLAPSYEQKMFDFSAGQLVLVAAPEGSAVGAALTIHQDVKLYSGKLTGAGHELPLQSSRCGWLQLISGQIKVGDFTAGPGDALAFQQELQPKFEVLGQEPAHFLFFDLPPQ